MLKLLQLGCLDVVLAPPLLHLLQPHLGNVLEQLQLVVYAAQLMQLNELLLVRLPQLLVLSNLLLQPSCNVAVVFHYLLDPLFDGTQS